MAPRMAAVLRAPGKLCSFSYVLFVFLLFYVLDVVSITVYDRDTKLFVLNGWLFVPLHGNFELRPLGATMGNASSVTRA